MENECGYSPISNEEENLDQKKLKLFSLFEQKIWRNSSEIKQLPFQIVRNENMAEMEIDIDSLLKQSIEENNFYSPKIPVSRTRMISAHQFLFDTLPYHPKNYQGEYPQSAKNIVEVLRLIEKISPPTTSYVLFKKGNIVTETQSEMFRLADSPNISMAIRLWRPNADNVWLEGRYWAGHPQAHNIKDIYHLEVFLVDQKGGTIHNLNQNLPPNGAIVLGSEMAADPNNNVAVFPENISADQIDSSILLELCHEVGHVQQFNDQSFRDNFQEQTGRQIEDFPASHLILEQDAWGRARQDLQNIEQTTGYKILPENWELYVHKRMENY